MKEISSSLKVVFLLLSLLFVFISTAAAELTEHEKEHLFQQGNELFRQANKAAALDKDAAEELYTKAARRFERLVQHGGINNGRLYYNIGNAYFRKGDLGRAILNYRRAERYISRDPNLTQNLEYARSRVEDRIEEKVQSRALKTILFWHYDLSSQVRLIIFLAAFLAFWCTAALRLFKRRVSLWLIFSCLFVSGMFLTSLLWQDFVHSNQPEGLVLAKEVVARKGDGQSYEPAFQEPLHQGVEFKLIEQRSSWYQIELADGRRSWIPTNAAELLW